MKIAKVWLRVFAGALLPVVGASSALGWGRDGHMMINRLAIQHLPADVPAFLKSSAAIDMMVYMGPEPDQWKTPQAAVELSAQQSPDHFIDLEWADILPALPRKRFDYYRLMSDTQPKYPNIKMTPENLGAQPWQVEEVYQRLKVGMWEYRKLVTAGQDTSAVEKAILFYAGWLGHYVADGSQPLHVTYQYNGWTGANPNGYTTEHKIHSLFESTYVKTNLKDADLEPLIAAAPAAVLTDEWTDYMVYLRASNRLVPRVYAIEKAGGFVGAGSAEAKAFTAERMAAGATELRDMIYTAWLRSGDPIEEYRGPA